MYHCLTFDWGDTLAANVGMPYQATQRQAFARLVERLTAAGCRVPTGWSAACEAELAVDWRRSIDREQNPQCREFDFQAMSDRWYDQALAAGGDRLAAQAAFAAFHDRLTDTVIPFAETAPVLGELRRRGYRIGILSHVPWVGPACRRWYQRHGLAELVDFYSLSCEIGWIKPNPAHFTHALKQAGCRADEILHVGDHPWRDVEGGRAAGFRTCLRLTQGIYPEEQLRDCRPDLVILRLTDLLESLP